MRTDWDIMRIELARTVDWRFALYQPNGTPAGLGPDDHVWFFLCEGEGGAPVLSVSSEAPLAGGSRVDILTRGTSGTTPAEVLVRFGQDDTRHLDWRRCYWGELVVDDYAETSPHPARKRAGAGLVVLLPSAT